MRAAPVILILGIIIMAAGVGVYMTPTPARGKLVVDYWYESSGHYPQSADVAQVLKAQLESTGLITVNLHSADWATFQNYMTNLGSMPVFGLGWWPDYMDVDDFTYPMLQSAAAGSISNPGYNSTTMDNLIELERTTLDPTQRSQIVGQIQDLAAKDVPLVPLCQMKGFAVTKVGVTGVTFDVSQNMYYYMINPPPGKDTLVVGTTDSVESNIDPAEDWSSFSTTLMLNIGAPLVYVKPGTFGGPNDFVPGLATSWTESPDGLTWAMNLRQGLKFQDGGNFTADDVVYSFDRGNRLAIPWGGYVGLGYPDLIANVKAASTYQVVFTLKHPVPWFLALMAFSASFPVNPNYALPNNVTQYVDGNPRASYATDLGPYTMTEWTRVGGKEYSMKLDANPNYFGAADGYPKTKHIIFKFYSDATSLASAIRAGDIDMAFRQLTISDLLTMKSDPNLKVWESPGAFADYFEFQERTAPFDNPQVRQAVAAAINRTELCSTVFRGEAIPVYSTLPVGMPDYKPSFMALEAQGPAFTASTLQSLGYTSYATQPQSPLALALVGVGAVVAIIGVLMLLRRRKEIA